MTKDEHLGVFIADDKVGTLALLNGNLAAFEYDAEWINNGFSLNPFSLPLEQKVFIPKPDPFEGLFGVFADSLPDGWGRLLVDRLLLKNKLNPRQAGNLARLAIVGNSGMGVLRYAPEIELGEQTIASDLDEIAVECKSLLKAEYSERLDELFFLGGSSGGARPKILTTVGDEEWIIKFPASDDGKNIGKLEYDYSLCAKECGILMEETRLFKSSRCDGYFGTKRFDRNENKARVHMVSLSGILETSHRIPNLDYDTLMKLTMVLTKDFGEIEKLFRLMCFNVFAHNRDDHSKNFSFLYHLQEKRWKLAPAYDLTFSHSIGGEHATTVHGKGANPGREDLLLVAKTIGLDGRKAKAILSRVYECVRERLADYVDVL
ncbi:MAG: type II toxin-antitoxin system HipA family toxin [Lachnospiraceae bacterium]|nr:type II toxin-antitoxin system HipA family toxin [Lachnospiraceae bacterium]